MERTNFGTPYTCTSSIGVCRGFRAEGIRVGQFVKCSANACQGMTSGNAQLERASCVASVPDDWDPITDQYSADFQFVFQYKYPISYIGLQYKYGYMVTVEKISLSPITDTCSTNQASPSVWSHFRSHFFFRGRFHPYSSDTFNHPGALLVPETTASHKITIATDHV